MTNSGFLLGAQGCGSYSDPKLVSIHPESSLLGNGLAQMHSYFIDRKGRMESKKAGIELIYELVNCSPDGPPLWSDPTSHKPKKKPGHHSSAFALRRQDPEAALQFIHYRLG